MKRRLIVALTILILLILSYTVVRIVIPSEYHGYIDILALSIVVYDVIYLFFGVARLIVYFIYGVFMIPSLFYFPEQYHLLLIFIFTIIIVLNPLAGLENFLDNNLNSSITKTFKYTVPGKYKTLHKYREEMKNHYHLPQMQKLYTKPLYRYLRTGTLIILFAVLIFLLLFSSSDIIIGAGLDVRSFVTLYLAILLSIALLILYKKGFSSMFRVFKLGGAPPVIFVIAVWNINIIAKGISIGILSIILVSAIVSEIFGHYSRVTYSSYHYFDPTTNEDVWANALYEPFVYSTNKKHQTLFEIVLPEELFMKQFKTLLISSNFFRTIITAYTFKRGIVQIFIEYYSEKDLLRVKRSIKKIYNVEITKEQLVDESYYEVKFLHNHEYIIARAIKLSNLLIELEIKEPVIISVSMHFKEKNQLNPLISKYKTILLEENENYCLVECSIKVENFDYLIETHLRNLLLEMLINGGTFVRVMVYY